MMWPLPITVDIINEKQVVKEDKIAEKLSILYHQNIPILYELAKLLTQKEYQMQSKVGFCLSSYIFDRQTSKLGSQ